MNIPVSKPHLTKQCKTFAQNAINTGEISGLFGNFITDFEEAFASWVGTKFAVACSNGTTALHLSLIAAGIKKGDEVLVADLTNMATFFAVLYIGAKPIPVDISLDTYTIDLDDIKSKMTPSIKALVVVHLFGQPVNVAEIRQVVGKEVKVIEDCAEAHGSEIGGKRVGSLGDFGAFSFFGNKNLTCGEGGIITTDSVDAYENLKSLRSLAFSNSGNKFYHQAIGFNYRLSNVSCAIGYSQTLQADTLISRRIEVCEQYDYLLSGIDEISTPVRVDRTKNTYWMYHIALKGSISKHRDKISKMLLDKGVETRFGFVPYSLQSKLHSEMPENLKCVNSISCANATFYLPTFLDISVAEQRKVSQKLREVINSIKEENSSDPV